MKHKIEKYVLNGRESSILALCAQIAAHDYEEIDTSEIDRYINLLDNEPKEIAKAIFGRKANSSARRSADGFVSWAIDMAKHGKRLASGEICKCVCKKCKANFNR